jgi:hypothetical protein
MQADAKHEEDNPQFGKLSYGLKVSDKPWSERPDGYPGEQVADYRRQPDPPGQCTSEESDGEGYRDIYKKWQFVHILSALTATIVSSDSLFNHTRCPRIIRVHIGFITFAP